MFGVLGEYPLPIFRMDQLGPNSGVGHDFVRRHAEKRLYLGADVDRLRILGDRIEIGDRGDLFHQRPEEGLGVTDARLRVLAIGDVLDLRDEIGGPPLLILDKGNVELDPNCVAALVDVSLVQLERRDLPGQSLLDLVEVAGEVVRMSDVLDRHGQ